MSGMEIPAAISIGSSIIGAGTSIAGGLKSSEASGQQAEQLRIAGQAQAEAATEGAAVQALSAREQGAAAREEARVRKLAADEQAAAFEFEGRQNDRTATRYRSAAAVDEAARRRDLDSSLQTIDAMRSGRGLSLDSPTARAIRSGVTEAADRDILASRTNYLIESGNQELAGELARRKARFSTLTGEQAIASGERSAASSERIASAIERAGASSSRAALLSSMAGARGAEAQGQSALLGSVGRVAGIGLDLARTMRPGWYGYGSGGGAPP